MWIDFSGLPHRTDGSDLICCWAWMELEEASGWRPAIGRPDVGGQFNRATADDTPGPASDSAPYITHPRIALALSLSLSLSP